MKRYETIVARGELAALRADVDGLRAELLRLQEESDAAQVGCHLGAGTSRCALTRRAALLELAGRGWCCACCPRRAGPRPSCRPQGAAQAAQEAVAAARVEAEAEADAIRAKAAAEAQAKAVSSRSGWLGVGRACCQRWALCRANHASTPTAGAPLCPRAPTHAGGGGVAAAAAGV